MFYWFLIMILILSSSDSVGWSDQIQFKTPPAAGEDEVRFLVFGDMGKAPLDPSTEHYIQVQLQNKAISLS